LIGNHDWRRYVGNDSALPGVKQNSTLSSIQDYRAFYANFVVASAGSSDEDLIAAFASVPREHYAGKGPWPVLAGARYATTPSDDPRWLYQDVVIGLATDRGINNGQPTLHSRCLVACAPLDGDSVVQIGAGTGYYTAILASLVGPGGKVIAYEIEADLARRARENLRHLTHVRIVNESATEGALPDADVIYVSAGATHPPASWLDALKVGGRLIFPLTGDRHFGVMLLITRQSPDSYAARAVSPAAFIPCTGARDAAAAEALTNVFQTWPIMTAKSMRRGTAPDDTAVCVGKGWWLSNAEPA
jgi:protein-L-isoaspartate(D-aspartate) O-methyltransferase